MIFMSVQVVQLQSLCTQRNGQFGVLDCRQQNKLSNHAPQELAGKTGRNTVTKGPSRVFFRALLPGFRSYLFLSYAPISPALFACGPH